MKGNLKQIKAFFFDVDGVLTDGTVLALDSGEQARNFYVKDGYAMVKAKEEGFLIAIISGGKMEGTRKRLEFLGVDDIYLGVGKKHEVYEKICAEKNLKREEILFMGDDLPDLKVMNWSGVSACPSDAANDIKNIADYICKNKGGQGAVREVIEVVMKAQFKWKIV